MFHTGDMALLAADLGALGSVRLISHDMEMWSAHVQPRAGSSHSFSGAKLPGAAAPE